jgi:hypothetical protein
MNGYNTKISNSSLSNFESGTPQKKDDVSDDFILTELKQKLAMTESVILDTSSKLGAIVIDVF